ncbi:MULTISPECIES: 3-hydroxyisobutyrate dehydrogenase [Corynebacterium]|uniref:3-hydroxyisobutyrate dehydrogenase n=1 Tax=Corynebacterium TaxID=1716 RepID=UPI0008A4AE4E|nr:MULTISPECIES: 3-hydroxyisobutyrate dehydrogenase [Corynebacterium]MDK6813635.1 3-hydroxyisobutyrate dehydrogenase [Corynebacterium sp. UMB6689]OFQ34295.1 3-hydroxyisobutyrate dehydrogenase [Corynebacterium sp. HMSC072D12]OFT64694.1 3-hydroxyisobutyrate dehydrogenase [Corynebacterium sp. HMSC05D03]QQU95283.1 3-hydroxyisobutyrate dehydrogenase [Corynebacterium aurimucosum]UTA71812.1 3-hydroxyisobutyrate dehydrogenase [Corynebacterium aurimucosum]
MTTIAFIGLGNMGGPMAVNLAEAGHEVRGFDVVEEARERAAEQGVTIIETAEEAAQGAEVVFTSLPNGGLVKQVIESVLAANEDAKTYVDVSTIAVAEARELSETVGKAGSAFLDAPVSGGIAGAAAGTLAFMVGGTAEDFAKVKPLLDIMGKSVTHCGDIGNGQAVKACNNMILAVQQIVLAEALVLGERLGLDHQAFYDVVSNATGNSWSLSVNAPVPDIVPSSPANNDFKPGFAAALMLKDLKLAMAAAEDTKTDTVLGRIAEEQYSSFVDEGHGGLDFSAIISEVRSKGTA